MKLTGAQILIEMLKQEGVDTIFGFPGGKVIDIYHELAKTDIKHILVRHEQGAIHAADGFARAGNRVGVCLVTSGPGATNTVTGIASAYMDSIPVVIITGQVPSYLIGNDAFQEVDIVGITRSCTKHNYLVKETEELARIVKEAFHLARSGRPGPVLIDIPQDIQQKAITFKHPDKINMRSYNPTYTPNMTQLKRVVQLFRKAKRPIIFSGGGAVLSKASQELTLLAQKLHIPVTSSLMGLGSFPGTDSLWLGMLGMHGTYRANMAINESDLILAVGVRFDDRVTGKIDEFAPNADIVHIDIDPTSIHKNIPVHTPVVGDCKITLGLLNTLVDKEDFTGSIKGRKKWLTQIEFWKRTSPFIYNQKNIIKPQYVIDTLYELTKGDAVITTEVGQNQMWTAQHYHFDHPGQFITSGGLGCMGFGLPAAIGAQVACPDKLVVDIAGDGSIQMNIQEIATAVQFNLPVKVVILNNQYLGMVRQWQELFYDKCYACTSMDNTPDFVKLAEAYGATGLKATRPEEVEPVLKKGLSSDKTVIMEFMVEREESVYPMVPAGKAINEMLLA
ncbi:MAG: biosynthetic-type acetolactate synthase large subunit [Deltaproteobacteria bacterium]|nr:biosynthetic-type acetolactate synthase large subunit [Deltaproteobacteria bacterium]